MAVFDDLVQSGHAISRTLSSGILPAKMEIMDQACMVAVENYKSAGLPVDAAAILLIEVDGRRCDRAKCRWLWSDVSQLLVEHDWHWQKPIDEVVTYQHSCHLTNVQKVQAEPLALLKSIPGIEFKEMAHPEQCCGSAGVYNLIHLVKRLTFWTLRWLVRVKQWLLRSLRRTQVVCYK